MRPVIVKTGSTLPELLGRRGDYEDWIVRGLGLPREAVDVVRVYEGEPLPRAAEPAAVVVTGSSAYVSEREPWSERAAAWLAERVAAGTPVLGICYGHQLLAHALGGCVERNPRGREMGTIEVVLEPAADADPLLGGLGPVLRVQATHVESVTRLPAAARRLAANAADPNHAFAVGGSAWGLQFHPEFDADVMRAYLVARRELLLAEGIDPQPLERGVGETPVGDTLLARFADFAGLSV